MFTARTRGLDSLLREQERVQREAMRIDPRTLKGEERIEYIRTNVLAAQAELIEVLNETGWKPWKTVDYGRVNRQAYLDELADVFIFLLNLCLVGQITGRDLATAIVKKWRINRRRQKNGY